MKRFDSLCDGRHIFTIDVLPYFRSRGCPADDYYFLRHDPHMSDLGHSVLADALEAELKRLDLLPPWAGGPSARVNPARMEWQRSPT
jgi:hypothetical protein